MITLSIHPGSIEVRPSDNEGRSLCIELATGVMTDVCLYLNAPEAFQLLDGLTAAIPHLDPVWECNHPVGVRLQAWVNAERAETPVQRETEKPGA